MIRSTLLSLAEQSVQVLQSIAQAAEAEAECTRLGLSPCHDRPKHWDNVLAIKLLLESCELSDPICDLGCRSGMILPWLYQLDFRNLWGCDMRAPLPPIKAAVTRGNWSATSLYIRQYLATRNNLKRAKVESTSLPSAFFGAATCMSVIEHGVDLPRFFREAHRILRPGGLLIVSTDYWHETLDIGTFRRYDGAIGTDTIFDRKGLEDLVALARQTGFTLLTDSVATDIDCCSQVVQSLGNSYTFAIAAFRKLPNQGGFG